MKKFGKVVGRNLITLVTYSLVIRLICVISIGKDPRTQILFLSAIAVSVHVISCLITSLAAFGSRDNETGRVWLGTTGVVLLVGFSVCLGNASLG
jgi:hypothetical protein